MKRDTITLLFCIAMVGCGTAVALSKQGQKPVVNSGAPSSSPSVIQPIIIASPKPIPTVPSLPPVTTTSPPTTQTDRIIRIDACNGQLAHANFRQFPSLAPSSILGVVPRGSHVAFTGRVALADGVQWYEGINPNTLLPNPAPGAQNQLEANQMGWIAGCFISQ